MFLAVILSRGNDIPRGKRPIEHKIQIMRQPLSSRKIMTFCYQFTHTYQYGKTHAPVLRLDDINIVSCFVKGVLKWNRHKIATYSREEQSDNAHSLVSLHWFALRYQGSVTHTPRNHNLVSQGHWFHQYFFTLYKVHFFLLNYYQIIVLDLTDF